METEHSAIYIKREAKQKLGLGVLLWLKLEKKRVKKYLKLSTLRGESLSSTLNSISKNHA